MTEFFRKFPLLFFVVLSLVLRVLSFHYSVIDHDESTYLVIANQLLKGDILYVDVWDTKPPGIFVLFAIFIQLFGKSIVMIRLITAVTIAFSAYLIYKAKLSLGSSSTSAFFAGILFVLFTSIYRFGMAANTEIYFTVFLILGLYFVINRNYFFLAGLAWGIAFTIKTVVAFDLLAFFLGGVIFFMRSGMKFKNGLKVCVRVFLGFVTPLLATIFYFKYTGHFDEYFYACWEIPSKYSSQLFAGEVLQYVGKLHLKYLPFVVLMYYAIFKRIGAERVGHRIFPLMILWFVLAMLATIIPGKYFEHYYLQLAIPISWMAAEVLDYRLVWIENWVKNKQRLTILFTLIAMLVFANQSYFFTQPDRPRAVVEIISNDLEEKDVVYAGNRYQVLYFLLDSKPPIKYIHPSLLTFGSHIRTLGIEPNIEFEKVFSQSPKYVILKNEHPSEFFREKLKMNYHKLDNLEFNKCLIYKVNDALRE